MAENTTHTFFPSGMGNRADFAACLKAGLPAGVSIMGVSQPVKDMIVEHNRAGGKLFVDSGVFSATPDFQQVMNSYQELAWRLPNPELASFVAPDALEDMAKTARLQIVHLNALRLLLELGVQVIFPFQRGWPIAAYEHHYKHLVEALGPKITIGLPCGKYPWTVKEVGALANALRPYRVHLLGVSGQRAWDYIEAITWVSPETTTSSDANRIRAKLGPGRELTKAVAEEAERLRIEGAVSFFADHLGDVPDLLDLEDPDQLQSALEALSDRFAEDYDDTEICYDLFNTPGHLSPLEAEAWARSFGYTDRQVLKLWRGWSQLPGEDFHDQACEHLGFYFEDPYGCRLGYLLEASDLSPALSLVRSPMRPADIAGHLKEMAERTRVRQDQISEVLSRDLERMNQGRRTINDGQMDLFTPPVRVAIGEQ